MEFAFYIIYQAIQRMAVCLVTPELQTVDLSLD